MKSLLVPANIDRLEEVTGFVNELLGDVDMKTEFQIRLAVEEVFVNIASYAYAPGTGDAEISCALLSDPKRFLIRFSDSGIPFDPTKLADADLSEEAIMERVGGLGIFLVKKNMDQVTYTYEGGRNVLTLVKRL
ncbi:MAG: ATP-binding protein [Lachnospiraceae bacterium]|nr:ATP-binding protein [Lachnospiraceae bacterium]